MRFSGHAYVPVVFVGGREDGAVRYMMPQDFDGESPMCLGTETGVFPIKQVLKSGGHRKFRWALDPQKALTRYDPGYHITPPAFWEEQDTDMGTTVLPCIMPFGFQLADKELMKAYGQRTPASKLAALLMSSVNMALGQTCEIPKLDWGRIM
jgi:hypothetical protein